MNTGKVNLGAKVRLANNQDHIDNILEIAPVLDIKEITGHQGLVIGHRITYHTPPVLGKYPFESWVVVGDILPVYYPPVIAKARTVCNHKAQRPHLFPGVNVSRQRNTDSQAAGAF